MELTPKEIKVLLAVIAQCSYNFENAKIIVSLAERLNVVLSGKEAEITKDK